MPAPLKDILIALCDAMVEEMAGAEFSQQFTPARVYDYTRDLDETEILRVDVVPEKHEDEPLSRTLWFGTAIVSIAIRQKIHVENLSEVDALTYLTGELRDFWTLPPRRLADYSGAGIIKRQIVYPYLQKQLRTHGQFVSVLQLTWQLACK